MIFEPEHYCAPASFFESSGSEAIAFGKEGFFGVALLSSGQCALLGQPQPVMACAGSFILSAAPLCLSPLQSSHIIGVLLGGTAAAQAAESLHAPAVLDAVGCPDAPEILYQLLAGQGSASPAHGSALAYTLLCRLANANPVQKAIPPLIAAAMADIRERYADGYGVEELAAGLGISKSHLVRSFTAAVGISPGRYLTAVRLDAAKRLLLHRAYTLDTIASLCGFASANYFCRVFKKETGQTPGDWRAKAAPQALPPPQINEWEEQLFL